jgi:hypothetical protein
VRMEVRTERGNDEENRSGKGSEDSLKTKVQRDEENRGKEGGEEEGDGKLA